MGSLRSSIYLIKFMVYCSPILFLYFPEKTKAIGSYFHDVNVTSLLAAETCNRQSSTGSNSRKYSTTLEVVHMFGPCSPQHEQTKNKQFLQSSKTSLLTQSGTPLKTLGHVVTIGLGTPQQNVTLMIDTGSELTWTQCKPCIECYKQRDPVYDPFSSSTYSRLSCGPECAYKRKYNDGSYSEGVVSKEKIIITHDVFEDFFFGCGQKNKGDGVGETAGILGLSYRGKYNEMSFLYQTAQKYGRYFSYCLPSTRSSTGHLTFGRKKSKHSAKNVKFTPLLPDRSYYRIEIVAISVGITRLPIDPSVFQNSRTIIDSGTGISRIPQEAYEKLRDAFKYMMGSSYPAAPAYQILDTCYYINNRTNVKYPFVSFTFRDGVEVQLHPSGIIYTVNSRMVCFAFVGNTDPNRHSVFGNIQQKTFEIVYDLDGERLGFGQGRCE